MITSLKYPIYRKNYHQKNDDDKAGKLRLHL